MDDNNQSVSEIPEDGMDETLANIASLFDAPKSEEVDESTAT